MTKKKEIKEETIAQKALRLLSEVPKDDFITGEFTDKNGKCCAIGHYVRLTSDNPSDFSNDNCHDMWNSDIRLLSRDFCFETYKLEITIAGVNNEDTHNGYNEDNPKDRVIHLLTDMVAEGL